VAYAKQLWTADTPVTPARLNYLEGQYDEVEKAFAAHVTSHRTAYYTRDEMLAKYMRNASGKDYPEGGDADTVGPNKIHASDITAGAVKAGIIVGWDDSEGPIPQGWEEFTAPAGRFIIGANSEYPIGSTGGNATITPTFSNAVTAACVLSIDQIPRHAHGFGDKYPDGGGGGGEVQGRNCTSIVTEDGFTDNAGGGSGHTHGIVISCNPVSNLAGWRCIRLMKKL